MDQENKKLANQTTLNLTLKTGAIEHDVFAGLEFLKEQQYNKTMATQIPGQTAITTLPTNLYHPDRNQILPGLIYNGGYTKDCKFMVYL